ncbi:unnamed protein product [Rotaria sordida]|uniref:Uncharacterized protein n=1 Tax=Rotaria sordida TaxID=392033 RepID=A0A815GCR1_9BILA|nr:unnamed protein product [Rotaria sordida]CAF1336681.1 unnamed protein product [Rotaria sordida]
MDLPLNLVTFFNRYSKEELHQIGISIIQYSQQFVNKQNHDIPPLQSHRSSNNPSSIIPPQIDIKSISSLIYHQHVQQQIPIAHPLMDQ